MNIGQFITHIHKNDPPGTLRMGQWLFNELWAVNPVLADKLRGTDADPFYQDSRITAFWQFVYDHWDET